MIPREAKPPIRTCVGCRKTADKTELLRVVAVGDELIVDPEQRREGRGAYVHRDPICVEAAASRGGLARSFRRRLARASIKEFATKAVTLTGIERGQS